MSSLANYSSQSLDTNLIVGGLYKENWNPSVFLIDQKYAFITKMSEMLSSPRYTRERDGKFHYATLGNLGVTATIAGRSTNLSNPNYIDVTWSDPTYDDIRATELWLSGISTQGRVVSHVPGKATFAPANGTAFTSSDFSVNQVVSFNYTATASNASGPTENRWWDPTTRIGYVGMTREDRTISRRELQIETWVDGFGPGKDAWNFSQQPLMVEAANIGWETRLLISKPYNNGTYQTSIGLLDDIRKNGQFVPLFDTQNMENKLIEMIQQLAIFGGSKTKEYIVLTGTLGLGLLQTNVFKQYIIYTGMESNLKVNGVAFEGINATCYAYGGITLKFVLYDMFDNQKVFPMQSNVTGNSLFSNTFLFLDPSPVKTTDGEMSAFQKVSWGNPGDASIGSYVVTGLIGAGGAKSLGDIGRDYSSTSNAIDAVSFGMWKDDGVYFPNVQAFGLMQPAF